METMRHQNVCELSNSSEKLVISRYIESARSFCKGKGRSSKLRVFNVFYLFTCTSCIAGEKKVGKSSGKAVIAWRSTQRNLKIKFFDNEVKNGYFWRMHLDNLLFNHTINLLSKEVKRNQQGNTGDMIYMLKHIHEQKV